MRKIGIVLLMGLGLAACSPRQERLAIGAGLGGATGAVVGGLATGTTGGPLQVPPLALSAEPPLPMQPVHARDAGIIATAIGFADASFLTPALRWIEAASELGGL